MVIITLEHNCIGVFKMEDIDCEHRAFLTMKEAEKWLVDNNFYYGQRSFLQYTPADAKEWCHQNDASWEFIGVSIEVIENPDEPSRYKDFNPGMAPWQKAAFEDGRREGYAQVLVEANFPRDEMIKRYMNHFDESKADAEYWISVCEEAEKERSGVEE
ncbi:MAG: hypothetical protein J6N21_09170 [Butyrivibrio sp.]|nr:hypothetical protein [Butyrivibrio sp.]